MEWLEIAEQILAKSVAPPEFGDTSDVWDGVRLEYDDAGLTVYSDLDGDGEVDRVSRMDYGGDYVTYERVSGAGSQWRLWESSTPEIGQERPDNNLHTPEWVSDDWG